MKDTCFIFCHGFGFDSTFWNPLKCFFSKQNILYMDLGYFADTPNVIQSITRNLDDNTHYIGVGHSLGLIKLLSLNIPFTHLIGLHGFIHFLGFDLRLHQTREREWMGLKRQFARSPELTLKRFYQMTGVSFDMSQNLIHRNTLQRDLDALNQSSILPPMVPTLILGAIDDSIVPPILIEDNFSSHSQVTIEILNQGQHALGFLNPDLVYRCVMRFIGFFII